MRISIPIKDAKQQYRKDRTDTAKRHQAKAVVLCIAVAADRSESDTQSHDERDSDWPSRNTAGVKCNRNKLIRNKKGQGQNNQIKNNQQHRKTDLKYGPKHSNYKKQADTDCNRPDQHCIRNRRHLLCEHL